MYIIIVALRICPLKFMHLKFEYTWYIFNFRFVKAAELFQETHVQQNTERWGSNTNISELSNIIRIYSKAAKRINMTQKRNDGIDSPLHSCYVYPKQRAVVVLSWSLHFVLLCGSWANASRFASGRGRRCHGEGRGFGDDWAEPAIRWFAICHRGPSRKTTFPLASRVCLIKY